MSTDKAIGAVDLCKDYKIYASSRDILMERLRGGIRHTTFSALKNVSFTVKKGEVLGIMGPNGAGKSTLLKIITGTLTPSSGKVQVNGKVSAILELGTGFTPHNTGRENIALGCLVLGMHPDEIRRKTPEIIAFSELEEFIDRPFGTYSSGMQARLTFAVAISTDPDVLIVDEALAVGDARFQQKCFGRIRAMRESGTSILLVSHDEGSITALCDRAIILWNGKAVATGKPDEMAQLYRKLLFGDTGSTTSQGKTVALLGADRSGTAGDPSPIVLQPDAATIEPTNAPAFVSTLDSTIQSGSPVIEVSDMAEASAYGDGRATIDEYGIFDEQDRRVEQLDSGRPYTCRFRLRAVTDLPQYTIGYGIRDRRGTVVWGATNLTQRVNLPPLRAGAALRSSIALTMWLAEGYYSMSLGSADPESGKKIAFLDNGVFFKVKGPTNCFATSVVNLEATLKLDSVIVADDCRHRAGGATGL